MLRERLTGLLLDWRTDGLPPRWTVAKTLREMDEWRSELGSPCLYDPRPLMLTATLDDGWGHGLDIIELCAMAGGLQIRRLGLMLSAETIVAQCSEHNPDLLGITMLQWDSEPALRLIADSISPGTRLLAGGSPFQFDPELAQRTGVHYVAANVADFLEYLLNLR